MSQLFTADGCSSSTYRLISSDHHFRSVLLPSMGELDGKESTPLLLPTTAPVAKAADGAAQPPALLGITCVAASALSFSLMTACIKYNTYSMTSMEAVFWRSLSAFLFNFVRCCDWYSRDAVTVALTTLIL